MDSHAWGHRIELWSSEIYFCFLQPLCCYFTLYKELLNQSLYFTEIYNHDPIVSGAGVDPTSQICSSAMLVLWFQETEMYGFRVHWSWWCSQGMLQICLVFFKILVSYSHFYYIVLLGENDSNTCWF
jgi:hypothetical protein